MGHASIPYKPRHLAVDQQGFVYITLEKNQVMVIDTKGKEIARWGKKGDKDGDLGDPTGILVTPRWEVVVSDFARGCLALFTTEGRFIRSIGKGDLVGPNGLCLDPHGNVIVIDSTRKAIVVYDQDWRKIAEGGIDVMGFPMGVDVTRDRKIIVADYSNHHLSFF
jgi:DNA-binding beta-propeller fold protein YncE